MRDPHPDTLVFSGGGIDGLSFIGCVRWLEQTGCMGRLRTAVGCSAGSIIATMLALGMTSKEMEELALRGIQDGSLREIDIGGIMTFVDRLGLDDGSRVLSLLRAEIRKRSPGGGDDMTFMELTKMTGVCLMVCVTNLEDSCREILSVDTAPDLGILEAVRMSIAIPLVFQPVRWKGKTYVDGGLTEHCPISHLYEANGATSTISFTTGLPLKADPPVNPAPSPAPSLAMTTYLSMIARLMYSHYHHHPGHQSSGRVAAAAAAPASIVHIRDVLVPSLMWRGNIDFDIGSLSFRMDSDTLTSYVQCGFQATKESLGSSD